MRNNKVKNYLSVAFVLVASAILTSCGGKLTPLSESMFNVTPSPLEVVGTKVPATVSGKFPEKWFPKNATITITPVLKYEGGEAYGTSQVYQGEKVAGNGIVISNKNGGNVNIKSEFNYVPAMQKSELFLKFNIDLGGKSLSFPDLKVADGVISTVAFATAASTNPAQAPDQFQKTMKEAHDASIMFLIQQANLRASELSSSDLEAWKNLVADAATNEKKTVDVEILAYASPDGGYKLNEGLAEQREKNTTQYLGKEFSKRNINTEINAKYTAQDWDGFKKLVEASNLQDKALVLSVLSMYNDPETREREIKNVSMIYSELAESILPKLRRSRLIANVNIVGKTDAELLALANADKMDELNIEELLYAASLDAAPKDKLYTFITKKYPNDYRAWNNLGSIYFAQGEQVKATESFKKALSLSPKAAEPSMNLALYSLESNKIADAEQLLGNASQANTMNEAMGLLYLKKGEYSKAVDAFGDAKTNNAAVALIATKNYSKAQQTLDAVPNKTAATHYLSAIVSARTNNTSGVAANLMQALQKDSSIKNYAKSDLELAKYLTNPDILNMLR